MFALTRECAKRDMLVWRTGARREICWSSDERWYVGAAMNADSISDMRQRDDVLREISQRRSQISRRESRFHRKLETLNHADFTVKKFRFLRSKSDVSKFRFLHENSDFTSKIQIFAHESRQSLHMSDFTSFNHQLKRIHGRLNLLIQGLKSCTRNSRCNGNKKSHTIRKSLNKKSSKLTLKYCRKSARFHPTVLVDGLDEVSEWIKRTSKHAMALDEKNRAELIYQSAGRKPAGNGAKLVDKLRASKQLKSRKEQNKLRCRQKEAQCAAMLLGVLAAAGHRSGL
ncbi:hypothetical protein F511_25609 [Dorcoceras hygrometricum]|uniref:Uncharacterized protein n=1 Tax=Dorcoceras hygrometricum TaxID=472368 RepID=A0A2Z7C220_9LAMI|nr:hypothetical protein F511_25609 [Dorcoceras hygrometricum]